MRARPEIRERILCAKLRRWARIGSSPHLYPNCSVSNARRNYAKLTSTQARMIACSPP